MTWCFRTRTPALPMGNQPNSSPRVSGCVSNHQPHDCLLNRLFSRRSKRTSKLRVTGLCAGNSPGTGEFPAQMASNAENVSISWRHHGFVVILFLLMSTGSILGKGIHLKPEQTDQMNASVFYHVCLLWANKQEYVLIDMYWPSLHITNKTRIA